MNHKVDTGSTRVTRSVSLGATQEVLLLGLEALAESADAFPPLKSAVCGLLFFVKQADVSPDLPSFAFGWSLTLPLAGFWQ